MVSYAKKYIIFPFQARPKQLILLLTGFSAYKYIIMSEYQKAMAFVSERDGILTGFVVALWSEIPDH